MKESLKTHTETRRHEEKGREALATASKPSIETNVAFYRSRRPKPALSCLSCSSCLKIFREVVSALQRRFGANGAPTRRHNTVLQWRKATPEMDPLHFRRALTLLANSTSRRSRSPSIFLIVWVRLNRTDSGTTGHASYSQRAIRIAANVPVRLNIEGLISIATC